MTRKSLVIAAVHAGLFDHVSLSGLTMKFSQVRGGHGRRGRQRGRRGNGHGPTKDELDEQLDVMRAEKEDYFLDDIYKPADDVSPRIV